MQLFNLRQTEGPAGSKKPEKQVRFQVHKIKVGNLGVLYKTELAGDPEISTFGLI